MVCLLVNWIQQKCLFMRYRFNSNSFVLSYGSDYEYIVYVLGLKSNFCVIFMI